jgi:hypothetical protein
MEARPTYLGTRSDHYTHCHDLPPQLGGALTLNSRTRLSSCRTWRLV